MPPPHAANTSSASAAVPAGAAAGIAPVIRSRVKMSGSVQPRVLQEHTATFGPDTETVGEKPWFVALKQRGDEEGKLQGNSIDVLGSFIRVEMQKRKAAREEREVKEKRRLKREIKKQSQEAPQPKKLKETWVDDTHCHHG